MVEVQVNGARVLHKELFIIGHNDENPESRDEKIGGSMNGSLQEVVANTSIILMGKIRTDTLVYVDNLYNHKDNFIVALSADKLIKIADGFAGVFPGKMAPTKEKGQKLREHIDDTSIKLGHAEMFLKKVLDVLFGMVPMMNSGLDSDGLQFFITKVKAYCGYVLFWRKKMVMEVENSRKGSKKMKMGEVEKLTIVNAT
uniref:Formin-like protein 1 n=1 Tax=Tanacetum cinerariifolium TaxID=118510 RepID=A0A6L2LGT8_TANCI|nr:formin-like protein 1 [Tanacetum cinerariifolium]